MTALKWLLLRVIIERMNKTKLDIITVTDLNSFFYESLSQLNNKSLCPMPEETIYYSSHVLNKFSQASEYFSVNDGKVKEKILGIQLLEAERLSKEEQIRVYKDIADTALMQSGYFSNSINKKILNKEYYINIGQIAYRKMYNLDSSFFDIPHFYKLMENCFEGLTLILKTFSLQTQEQLLNSYLLELDSEKEYLINGILPQKSNQYN